MAVAHWLRWLSVAAWAVLIATMTWSPSPPQALSAASNASHLAGFLVWTFLIAWACRFNSQALLSCLPPAAAFAVAAELLQALVPTRSVQLLDMCANLFGVGLGAGLALLLPASTSGGNLNARS